MGKRQIRGVILTVAALRAEGRISRGVNYAWFTASLLFVEKLRESQRKVVSPSRQLRTEPPVSTLIVADSSEQKARLPV